VIGEPFDDGAVQLITELLKLIVVVGEFGLEGTLAQRSDNTDENVLVPYEFKD